MAGICILTLALSAPASWDCGACILMVLTVSVAVGGAMLNCSCEWWLIVDEYDGEYRIPGGVADLF